MLKNNKGITLIALVVTIIVLLILAGVSINMLTGQNGILNRASEAKEKTENTQTEELVKFAIMSSIGTDGLVDISQLKTEIESQGGRVVGTTFPVAIINEKKSYQVDQYGNISEQTKNENIEENWTMADISNHNDDWYAYKDNSGNKAQVNTPKLANGMIAIKYKTEVTGSKWANAITKDGSMWVWIPRYAYRITYNDSTDRSKGGTIDIAFLKGTTNEFLDNSIQGEVVTAINTDGTTPQGKWVLEPAFTLGTENISGFWFAKFEASNTDGYGDNSVTADNPDLTLKIKPNVTSWRNISALNIFTACQSLTSESKYNTYFSSKSNVDTHMTKNVEWGAVAYLAHSKYGLNGEEIEMNGSYTTGNGKFKSEAYNTDVGKFSSTTKNVYGIYDMSGCAYEYVAACYTGYTNKLTANTDSVYINKYIDVYDSYSSAKFGDAIFETSFSSSSSNSWFSDFSGFVNSHYNVFKRGGSCNDGSQSGLFHFSSYSGSAYITYGFRPVCIVK